MSTTFSGQETFHFVRNACHEYLCTSVSAGAELEYCFQFYQFRLHVVGLAINTKFYDCCKNSCGSVAEEESVNCIYFLGNAFAIMFVSIAFVCYWFYVFLCCASQVRNINCIAFCCQFLFWFYSLLLWHAIRPVFPLVFRRGHCCLV